MPLGTNEHQVVIEIFTAEAPAIKIRPEAKAFIAKQIRLPQWQWEVSLLCGQKLVV